MTDLQLAAIRDQALTLCGTHLSGDLHVRDEDGADHLLDADGELQPFRLERWPRESAGGGVPRPT